MKYLSMLFLLATAFLAGCSTLEMKLTDRATGQPISGATILVQYVNINDQSKDLDIIGTTTTDDQGRANLEALFRKHTDLQLFISRQNDRYQTILVWKNIAKFSQTVTGIQSLKADQKVADPSTPAMDLKYRWKNSDAPSL